MKRWRYGIPLAALVVLIGLLAYGLGLDPRHVPSPLVGRPLPALSLPVLGHPDPQARWHSAALLGKPFMLNVWASWCVSCREEHPLLVELSGDDRLPVYGLNYRDREADALAWLERWGDPYIASVHDPKGSAGLTLGVYAVPETFLIDAEGHVRYKHIGPLTRAVLEEHFVGALP